MGDRGPSGHGRGPIPSFQSSPQYEHRLKGVFVQPVSIRAANSARRGRLVAFHRFTLHFLLEVYRAP